MFAAAEPIFCHPGNSAPARRVVRYSRLSADVVSDVFLDLKLQGSMRLRGEFVRSELDDLVFIHSLCHGDSFRVLRSERLIQSSASDDYFVCLLLGGHVSIEQEGRGTELSEGDVAVLDSTRAYAIDMSGDRSGDLNTLWIKVPRARLKTPLISLGAILGRKVPGRSALGHVAANMIIASAQASLMANEREQRALASQLVDMLRLAFEEGSPCDAAYENPHSRQLLLRAQRTIEDHLAINNLTPAFVAERLAISPRYLSRIFAAEGTTVMKWIVGRRLENCRRMLLDPRTSGRFVSEIAYACGFNNIASFNRTFKRRYGVAPRVLQIRASTPSSKPDSSRLR